MECVSAAADAAATDTTADPAASMSQHTASEEALAKLLAAAQRVAELSKHLRETRLTVGLRAAESTAAELPDGTEEARLPAKTPLAELVDFSVLASVPLEERRELLTAAAVVPGADRAAGALVGLAVADGLGAPFEFLPAVDEPSAETFFDLTSFTAVGAEKAPEITLGKGLKDGQWTDDTSMALCLADSLLMGSYDGSDVRVRFWNWWHKGYNNGFRKDSCRKSWRSVGLGMNVGKSLDAIHDASPPSRYEALSEDSGNGSLMRLAPVPIAFARDVENAMQVSAESSRTTHPGRIAASACRFLGFLLCRALTLMLEQNACEFLDAAVNEYLEKFVRPKDAEVRRLLLSAEAEGSLERCWNWREEQLEVESTLRARAENGSYNGYPVNRAYFGSYCMDGLAVALHSFYHSSSFLQAIARCVNFLGDADSTAAICGQLAGAFYGLQGIDRRLVARLEQWDDQEVACRAVLLWCLGAEAPVIEEPEEASPVTIERTPEISRLMEMGFSAAEADAALRRAGGDLENAAQILLCG